MRAVLIGVACAVALAAPGCASAQAKSIAGIAQDRPSAAIRLAHVASANLPYRGGPVLHWNRTHLIFWAPSGSGLRFDPGYEALIERFLRDVAAASHSTSNVYGLSGQYADSAGPAAYASAYRGAVVATDPLPANGCLEPPVTGPGWLVCLNDGQLEAEIERVVRAHRLAHTAHDAYFLVTPRGLGSCTDSSSKSCALGGQTTGYCGYHAQTASGLLYAVIPYNAVSGHCQSGNPRPNASTADPALSTVSHEQIEIVTDPYGSAWVDSSGKETGDLCIASFGAPIGGSGQSAYNQTINGGHYYLQEEWSNRNRGCRQRAAGDSARFSARRVGGARWSFTARAHDPDGRIVGFRWLFDGRGTAFGPAVVHRFGAPGSHRVTVRATDSWGNWSFYTRAIRVSARG